VYGKAFTGGAKKICPENNNRCTGRHFTGGRKKFALKITICPKNKQFALKITFWFNPNGA